MGKLLKWEKDEHADNRKGSGMEFQGRSSFMPANSLARQLTGKEAADVAEENDIQPTQPMSQVGLSNLISLLV